MGPSTTSRGSATTTPGWGTRRTTGWSTGTPRRGRRLANPFRNADWDWPPRGDLPRRAGGVPLQGRHLVSRNPDGRRHEGTARGPLRLRPVRRAHGPERRLPDRHAAPPCAGRVPRGAGEPLHTFHGRDLLLPPGCRGSGPASDPPGSSRTASTRCSSFRSDPSATSPWDWSQGTRRPPGSRRSA